MDGVATYDPTLWERTVPVESLRGSYDALGWDGPGEFRQVTVNALAVALTQLGPKAELLDVGCYTGDYFGRLREKLGKAFVYTGVDVTPGYIAAARERWKHQAEQAHFEQGSVLGILPRADIVHCSGLLIHLEDAAGAITRLTQAARVAVFVGVDVDPTLTQDWRCGRDGPFINRVYRPGYIAGLLARHGKLQPVTVTGEHALYEVRL